jgi:hypothetical protein
VIIFARVAEFPTLEKQISTSLVSLALLFETFPQKLLAYQDAQLPTQAAQAPRYMQQSAGPLQQLAFIALYPDSLVSEILTASTVLGQVARADRSVQSHRGLKGDALRQAVDHEPWASSIEALASFPSALGNMDKNRCWASSLGEAYNNQKHDAMDAVQVVRGRAQASGHLKTTQQDVTAQSSTGAANRPLGGNFGASDADYNRPIATPKPSNGSTQAARGYAGPYDQSGVGSDAFSGYDHDEQQKKRTAGKPQAKWQVGTVTAVRPYQVPDADPSVTSYKVSVRVGHTVYVVLNTPRPGTDIGRYARGRAVMVLVGEHTITYNDLLGNSFEVPILSRTTVTPRGSR